VTVRNDRPPGASVAVGIAVTGPALSAVRSFNSHRCFRRTAIPGRHYTSALARETELFSIVRGK